MPPLNEECLVLLLSLRIITCRSSRHVPLHRNFTRNYITLQFQKNAMPPTYNTYYNADADRWGKRKLGVRPGNGAPLRARVASFFLPCERGLNSHTNFTTRPPTPAPQCRLSYHPRRRPDFVYCCILGRITKHFIYVPATSIGRSARLFLVIPKEN